jgi:hypothetical protein
MSAADAQATLEYLVPGFVALKVFYVLGLRTRRSDLEWTILSVAAAALVNAATSAWFGVSDVSQRALVATVLGVGVAFVGAWAWRRVAPAWGHYFERQAWDAAFARGGWMSVWVKDGPIVLGWAKTVSESAEADAQDVYLVEPSFVDRESNAETKLPTVRGIWVAADEIELVEVMRRPDDPAATA